MTSTTNTFITREKVDAWDRTKCAPNHRISASDAYSNSCDSPKSAPDIWLRRRLCICGTRSSLQNRDRILSCALNATTVRMLLTPSPVIMLVLAYAFAVSPANPFMDTCCRSSQCEPLSHRSE
jgi:hypothetical protein